MDIDKFVPDYMIEWLQSSFGSLMDIDKFVPGGHIERVVPLFRFSDGY